MSESDPLLTLSQADPQRTSNGVASAATLTAVHPLDLDWQLQLGDQLVTIGRDGDARVPALANRTVSRRHVEIRWNGAAHVISDLGGRNGSRLDGVRLGETELRTLQDGSVLQLGDVFVIYERTLYERGAPIADAEHVSKDNLPGRAMAMRRLRTQVGRAAADPSAVLILGETGTGKEWIARELHRLSQRPGPLVALNCAALGSSLIESQLFGHVKGAFTGATSDQVGLFRAAEGGTLFLDEIGELPLDLQPKLLRALQDGQITPVGATRALTVDVRVVAATNRDLETAISQRAFRLDLYSRLALWEIAVPPLRARRVDILAWLARLQRVWLEARPGIKGSPMTLQPDAVQVILLHPWLDNLRGLDRLVHVLQSTPSSGPLARADLPSWLLAPPHR